MTKRDMLEILIYGYGKPIVYYEFRSKGYDEDVAIEKTIQWYMRKYTKEIIRDIYAGNTGGRM